MRNEKWFKRAKLKGTKLVTLLFESYRFNSNTAFLINVHHPYLRHRF